MRLLPAVLLSALMTICAFEMSAQDTSAKALTQVEQMPEFEGGINELLMFIADNLNYPRKAQRKELEGLVIVSFIVRTNGDITDIDVLKDIGKGCGKEAARVVALTNGMWTPGEQRGEPVNVQYNLPIRFKLTD